MFPQKKKPYTYVKYHAGSHPAPHHPTSPKNIQGFFKNYRESLLMLPEYFSLAYSSFKNE